MLPVHHLQLLPMVPEELERMILQQENVVILTKLLMLKLLELQLVLLNPLLTPMHRQQEPQHAQKVIVLGVPPAQLVPLILIIVQEALQPLAPLVLIVNVVFPQLMDQQQ